MSDQPGADRFDFEIDPERIEETLRELGERVRQLVAEHRFSKVRLSYRGKQLLPDIPLALFLGAEAATFWWTGPLRVVLLNLGMGSILTVELVNEADEQIEAGKSAFMDGDIEEAEEAYRLALRMKPGSTSARYNLGVLLRVSGRTDEALEQLRAASGAPDHPDGSKALALLEKMGISPEPDAD